MRNTKKLHKMQEMHKKRRCGTREHEKQDVIEMMDIKHEIRACWLVRVKIALAYVLSSTFHDYQMNMQLLRVDDTLVSRLYRMLDLLYSIEKKLKKCGGEVIIITQKIPEVIQN